jgi:hypothetical protein
VPTRRATWLPLAAVVANGLLVGASLDQSIKQLPARHHIGPAAFAADFVLQPGVVAGLVPWWLTGWQVRQPAPSWAWAPLRVAGLALLAAGAVGWCTPSSASWWRAWAPPRPSPRPGGWWSAGPTGMSATPCT